MAFKLGTSLGGRKMDSLFLVDEILVFLAVSIIHVIALIADTLPWWASVVPLWLNRALMPTSCFGGCILPPYLIDCALLPWWLT